MTQRLYTIIACLLLSLGIISGLYFLPTFLDNQHQSFHRKFAPHFLTKPHIKTLENSRTYIIGMDSTTLYLGDTASPLLILKYDFRQGLLQQDTILLNTETPIAWQLLNKRLISNKLYLYEGLSPSLFEYALETKTTIKRPMDSLVFTDCIPLSSNNIILKTTDAKKRQQVLARWSFTDQKLHIPHANLTKQVDGFFCTDGDVIFNEAFQLLIYTYRYRNAFLVFDTQLNLISTHHTIDPHVKADLKVATVKVHGRDKIKLASVPNIVNRGSFSQGPWLFLNSNIRAQNESDTNFKSKSVIDIYALEDGRYTFSFYIPPYQGSTMTDFAIYNNTLAVLYPQGIGIYNMSLNPVTDLKPL